MRISYDPTQVTYDDLLQQYLAWHTPIQSSGQYRSLVSYDGSKQLASASRLLGARVQLVDVSAPEGRFWSAEDYHQKYRLRRHSDVVEELRTRFGPRWDEHALVTRLNAFGRDFDVTPWTEQLPIHLRHPFKR